MEEIWKPVAGYEKYEVSNIGRVKSYAWSKQPIIRRQEKDRDGYLTVVLKRNTVRKRFFIHRLVLLAFNGPCPQGMEASHTDGDKCNNELSNLTWESHADNILRKINHGTVLLGENSPASKLNEVAVKRIRESYDGGQKVKYISKYFGISTRQCYKIINRENWRHVA